MKCTCGFNGRFNDLQNTGSALQGEYYILKPGMQSKYDGLVKLVVCPKCSTVKAVKA